ncbi:MAG TPA: UDP-N-acetylmuramate dehydrogenase [Patescibacteria group bacterium]|nr:UDP-N-acetylmuramate dehydrogenase [Patescibacteria group bacterium]
MIREIRGRITGDVLSGERLERHTAYRVGGEAEILACARDSDEAARVYRYARRAGAPLTIIGGGTNVIAPDGGIAGIVLKLKSSTARVRFLDGGVWADAGVDVVDLAREAARKGFGGLVSIAGVPGTVGGAVLMNAKVVEQETAALIRRVAAVTGSGRRRVFQRSELAFAYRSSMFQQADWLILGAEFALTPVDPREAVREVEAEWTKWRTNFPLDPPNAGSVFKRPPGDFAGRLVEEAGCKGLRVGGAEVSRRHANFIYNTGGATAGDILALIADVRRRVFEKSGVYLELEQIPLPSNR